MVKQITIISGKGGTGKTIFVAGLAFLTREKAVFADADVDAPDLHLILHPVKKKEEELYVSKKVVRDNDKCIQCNICGEVCQFEAIDSTDINFFKCEGCGLCVHQCPENALTLEPVLSAKLFESETRFGFFVHVEMTIGEGSSGRIVDQVKQKAKTIADDNNLDYLIIDGSPGIGCPVISSITGADLACIIVEPTLSGIHDLERILDVTDHFKIKAAVCINKYDLNINNSNQIEKFCKENNKHIVGKIPYHEIVPTSIIEGKSVFEYKENPVSIKIKEIWDNIKKILET